MPRPVHMAARLLIPVLLGALLSRADACSSNSDCSENTFCSVSSEGCMKCFWDWSDAEIKGDDADANTFRSMSCAEHLDQEDETASLANCEAACACQDDNDEAATDASWWKCPTTHPHRTPAPCARLVAPRAQVA